MEVNNYNTYFNVIFKCVGKEDTISLHDLIYRGNCSYC